MTIVRSELETTDFADVAPGERLAPISPGEILLEEFMSPMNLSAYAVAKAIGVPANRVTAILHGDRSITADTALRLAAYFSTSAELWMTLQTNYDLAVARRARAA